MRLATFRNTLDSFSADADGYGIPRSLGSRLATFCAWLRMEVAGISTFLCLVRVNGCPLFAMLVDLVALLLCPDEEPPRWIISGISIPIFEVLADLFSLA